MGQYEAAEVIIFPSALVLTGPVRKIALLEYSPLLLPFLRRFYTSISQR